MESFNAVEPGRYTVTVTGAGFMTVDEKGLVVESGDTILLDLKLPVGKTSDSVDVSAAEPVVNNGISYNGQLIDAQKLENLPNPGRNPFLFSKLDNTVTRVGGPRFVRFQDQSGSSTISIAGAPTSSNDYSIDGVPTTENLQPGSDGAGRVYLGLQLGQSVGGAEHPQPRQQRPAGHLPSFKRIRPRDQRHPNRGSIALTYDLPFRHGKPFLGGANRWVDPAVGGWTFNDISIFQEGSPLPIGQSTNVNSSFGNAVTRPSLTGINPFYTGSTESRLAHYFNGAAYTPTTVGNTGLAERTSNCYGPGYRNSDLSLNKDFRITERIHTQFRAEALNAFNTPQFKIRTWPRTQRRTDR